MHQKLSRLWAMQLLRALAIISVMTATSFQPVEDHFVNLTSRVELRLAGYIEPLLKPDDQANLTCNLPSSMLKSLPHEALLRPGKAFA
jgi:hypothetical protein